MPAIRCFIAVEVEDSAVTSRIGQIQQSLLSSGAKLKLVEAQNLHFTLHFLGNIDAGRIAELSPILQTLKGEPFEVELVGVGCFRPQRPRVIWIGCTTGADHLIRHQEVLRHQLMTHRFPYEKRKYSPHLTVARVRSGQNRTQLIHLVDQYANHEFGTFEVNAIKLKKSTLTPKGPIYEDLAIKKFNESN